MCRVSCRAGKGREEGPPYFVCGCLLSKPHDASHPGGQRLWETDTSSSILIANGDGRSIGYGTPSQHAAASAGDNIDVLDTTQPPPFFLPFPHQKGSCSRVSPRNVYEYVSGREREGEDMYYIPYYPSQYAWVCAQVPLSLSLS